MDRYGDGPVAKSSDKPVISSIFGQFYKPKMKRSLVVLMTLRNPKTKPKMVIPDKHYISSSGQAKK